MNITNKKKICRMSKQLPIQALHLQINQNFNDKIYYLTVTFYFIK